MAIDVISVQYNEMVNISPTLLCSILLTTQGYYH